MQILRDLPDFELLVATLSPEAVVEIERIDSARARSLCDGFGKMTVSDLFNSGSLWDWSHVKNSSPEAMKAAADYIRNVALLNAEPTMNRRTA